MTMKAKDMAVHSGVFRLLSSNSMMMLSLMKLHGKPGITAIGCYGNRHGFLPFVLVRSHRYHVTLPLPPPLFFFSVSTSPQNGKTCMCCVRMKYFILESGHHTNSSVPVLRNWLPNLSSMIFFCYLCTTSETLFNKVPIVIGLCLSKTQTLMFMTELTIATFSNQVFY